MRPIIVFTFLCCSILTSGQNYNLTYISKVEFPGYTCANIWGYAAGGKEYALVGVSNGLAIVDITDPTQPVILEQITDGINSLWREIKTYSTYAYITSEGLDSNQKGGLGIADLSGLPNVPVPFQKYHGDGAINDDLKKVHALDVDEVEGYVYLYGPDAISPKGIISLKLLPDPYNPTYAGQYTGSYVHDGYSNNGMVYGSHIFGGYFSIIDFTNKSNPTIIATQTTPNSFTHNTWLSLDGNYIFTTDEKSNSYLAAYDISDPTDIQETDRIQTTPGSGSIVHNTYIWDHYAVSSWYKDGVTITDISRPSNIIQIARYDTYGGSGNGFEGAWGVYPYLPSQNILVTNIEESVSGGGMGGVLYILAPSYVDACYLEGNVKDMNTNQNLPNVSVEIDHTDPLNSTETNIVGEYATGQPTSGTFDVNFKHPGYNIKTMSVTLSPGIVTQLDVQLEPLALPLEFAKFTAINDGSQNFLEWSTAQEANVGYFEIQRKGNDESSWQTIGAISAIGNSQIEQTYRFSDNSPLPHGYYRIKAIDFDKSFDYSHIESVKIISEKFSLKKIYPIPSTGIIRVEIVADSHGQANLSVFGITGANVIQQSLILEPGMNYQIIELPQEWIDGTYWVKIKLGLDEAISSVVLRR